MNPRKVLITGAGGSAGINFARSLSIAPVRRLTVGTEVNKYHRVLAETDVCHIICRADDLAYLSELNKIIEKENIDLVCPQPDIEVERISQFRESIDAIVFLPSKEAIRICQNKLLSHQTWKKAKVTSPETVIIFNEDDINEAGEILGLPFWVRASRGAGGRGATLVESTPVALWWIRYWQSRKMDWSFIAQKYLSGRNVAWHSIWQDGKLITSMARERVQYIYPYLSPSGVTGTPSVQRTIHDILVNQLAMKAVLAVDPKYTGLACVDIKEDEHGEPFVTEINAGRMFTTNFFFSFVSKTLMKNYYCNFPYLLTKLAYGEDIPELPIFNALPENLYWIRHMDAPAKLVWRKNWEKDYFET